MKQAIKCLNDNLEKILDEFPVDGELKIKYNKERIFIKTTF